MSDHPVMNHLKPRLRSPRRASARKGAVLVLVIILLPLFLIFAAFCVNVAYMQLVRTELQISTDAAVRAGGRTFATSGDMKTAMSVAKEAASRNEVAGAPLRLADADIEFGESVRKSLNSRYIYQSKGNAPNSMQITGRRDKGSLDGPVRFVLPVIGAQTVFEPRIIAHSTQMEIDVALVIDKSGSMAYAADELAAYPPIPSSAPAGWDFCDAAPKDSRWRNVVAATKSLLNELEYTPLQEKVSLCTYSDKGKVDVKLTSDYNAIMKGLDKYTKKLCAGQTNIGAGLSQGVNSLVGQGKDRLWAAKVVIILTDGIQTTGSSPVPISVKAFKQGVMVFTVTFSDEADIKSMQKVASSGGGVHFHAKSGNDLINAFKEIGKTLPTLLTK